MSDAKSPQGGNSEHETEENDSEEEEANVVSHRADECADECVDTDTKQEQEDRDGILEKACKNDIMSIPAEELLQPSGPISNRRVSTPASNDVGAENRSHKRSLKRHGPTSSVSDRHIRTTFADLLHSCSLEQLDALDTVSDRDLLSLMRTFGIEECDNDMTSDQLPSANVYAVVLVVGLWTI